MRRTNAMTAGETLRGILRAGGVLAVVFLAACGTPAVQPETEPAPVATVEGDATHLGGPCTDSSYTSLRQRPVDSLSAREWQRLQALDRQCATSRAHRSHAVGAASHGGHMMGTGILATIVMVGMMVAMWR